MVIQQIIDQRAVGALHQEVVHVEGLEVLDRLVVEQRHHLCQEEVDEVKESV